jgi:DNA repair exonuclease SbcCD ATPase subunit
MSFGPEGIELDLLNLGNIVLIKGTNLDVKESSFNTLEKKESSNGSGKSTIQEILSWTLYGKTIKKPEKIGVNDVAHNKFKKGTVTSVEWDDFRVERGRFPAYLKMWESKEGVWNKDTEITKGTNTQKIIEEKLGLNYEAFINICIFSDDNRSCFLEQDGPSKRSIVENLLSMGEIKNWHKNAKDLLKELKTQETTYSKEYDLLKKTKSDNELRLKQYISKEQEWKTAKLAEIKALGESYNTKKKELENLDIFSKIKEYDDAQIRIAQIQERISQIEDEQSISNQNLELQKVELQKIDAFIQEISFEIDKIKKTLSDLNTDFKKSESEISKLENKTTGVECCECFQEVPKDNYENRLTKERNKYAKIKASLDDEKTKAKVLLEKLNNNKKIQTEIKEKIQNYESVNRNCFENIKKLNGELGIKSRIAKPSTDAEQEKIIQQVQNIKEQAKKVKAEYDTGNPYVEIIADTNVSIENSEKDCLAKEADVDNLRKQYPYVNYFITAFGEDGIRKWIIDDIIPSLNTRIQYWLQFLMDGAIKLEFNNTLEEKIEQSTCDDNPFIYHAMSAGERRRLNLAISQAFSYIMSINTGCEPSLVFLDEVTTNIDPVGVQGIFNMISELSQEKQVFVTTHDKDLLDMLQNCKIIKLQKKDGITTRIDE